MQLANPENFKQFVQIKDRKTVTNSELVAKVFGKQHKNVLRDIRELIDNCDEDFAKLNFELCFKINELQNGKATPYYELTKNGFMLLVIGYKKPLLEARLNIFEDQIHIELPLSLAQIAQ